MCVEKLNSSCLAFFWNSLFEVVFILNFTFAVFFYHGATVTLRFHDSVLIFFYISCFQKSIYLVYNDSSDVCSCFLCGSPAFCEFLLSPITNDTLVLPTALVVLQKL